MKQETAKQPSRPPIFITSEGSTWEQLAKSSLLVLGILFFVTGAVGLPLLWSSPAFSVCSKWIWTVIVTIYTILLIAIVIAIVWWAYSTIVNATY